MPRLARFSVWFRDIEIKPLVVEVPDHVRANHLDQILWDMDVVVKSFNERSSLDKAPEYDRFVARVVDGVEPDRDVPTAPFRGDVIEGYVRTLLGDLKEFKSRPLPEIDFDLKPNRVSRLLDGVFKAFARVGEGAHLV